MILTYCCSHRIAGPMRLYMQAVGDLARLTVKSILEAISAPVGYCSRATFGRLKGWMPCNSIKWSVEGMADIS